MFIPKTQISIKAKPCDSFIRLFANSLLFYNSLPPWDFPSQSRKKSKNVITPAAIQKKSGRPYKAYCLPQSILPRCKGASYYERLGASSLAASSSLRSWSTIAQTEESDQTFSHVSIMSMMV